jgi:hypothetical protein
MMRPWTLVVVSLLLSDGPALAAPPPDASVRWPYGVARHEFAMARFQVAQAQREHAEMWRRRAEAKREVAETIAREFFAPELVMKQQEKIDLTEAQRKAITGAISDAQSHIVNLQWQMQSETQKLIDLTSAQHLDENATLSQLDKVLGIERDVKRQHVTLLIRIKNTLTPEQQSQLKTLRDAP